MKTRDLLKVTQHIDSSGGYDIGEIDMSIADLKSFFESYGKNGVDDIFKTLDVIKGVIRNRFSSWYLAQPNERECQCSKDGSCQDWSTKDVEMVERKRFILWSWPLQTANSSITPLHYSERFAPNW